MKPEFHDVFFCSNYNVRNREHLNTHRFDEEPFSRKITQFFKEAFSEDGLGVETIQNYAKHCL